MTWKRKAMKTAENSNEINDVKNVFIFPYDLKKKKKRKKIIIDKYIVFDYIFLSLFLFLEKMRPCCWSWDRLADNENSRVHVRNR